MTNNNLEAKICVLGAQGVGKTSLLHRYVKGTFSPPTTTSTIGASFLTKRVVDIDSGATVRLQLWDTAGQERFRSISKLYYRGASAVLLVYSIIDDASFTEMARWLQELKTHLSPDIIIHVVGTKSDIVASDPSTRRIPFERCIAYVASELHPTQASTPPPTAGVLSSSDSKRSSGFWGQDVGWDCCHEISAKDGEGIEEVFRVITRKIVERELKRAEGEHPRSHEAGGSAGEAAGREGYFDGVGDGGGSFRLGLDKRKSWVGFMTPNMGIGEEGNVGAERVTKRKGGCC